jgi:hypothetical protein
VVATGTAKASLISEEVDVGLRDIARASAAGITIGASPVRRGATPTAQDRIAAGRDAVDFA